MARQTLIQRGVRVLGSFGLSCILLILLALLTFLGTLEQVNHGLFEVQKKYFESFVLIHHAGAIPIPLPGANLVMCVLAVNLVVGGILRLRRGWDTAGVLVVHLGIGLLLLSGLVKTYFSEEGHVTLFEGQRSNSFQSYYRWEVAILRSLGGREVHELLVPQEDFADATGSQPATLTSDELPFDLEIAHFMRNCQVMPKGPMFDVPVPVVDGFFLREEPLAKDAEHNVAGAYATVVLRDGTRQTGVLWGMAQAPWTVRVGDVDWMIDLRRERYPMPFTVVLDVFTKTEHPRTTMASSFSSDVTVIEGPSSRPVKIEMNEPLRDQGLVLYQASWGPSNARPGDALFSTLSVVRNPADQYPLYACIVIACGLTLHFSRKLGKYMRTEARR
jgi:hypothetical protein